MAPKTQNLPAKTAAAAPTVQTQRSPLIALGARFNIDPGKLMNVMRGTIIKPDKSGKPATDEEVAAFCIVAQQYNLNPFTREIHAFTSGEKGVIPIVGIDGWTKIVNTDERFDGCEFEEHFDEAGKLVAMECSMHVRGRSHPVRVKELMAECKRNTGPWNQMPNRMLRHKAFMQAARYAFGLSGIYDEDEARDIVHYSQAADPARIAMPTEVPAQIVDATPAAQDDQEAQPAPAATHLDRIREAVNHWTDDQRQKFFDRVEELRGEGNDEGDAYGQAFKEMSGAKK